MALARVLQNHEARWYAAAWDDEGRQIDSFGPFETRMDAAAWCRARIGTDGAIFMEGITDGAAEPPPLPRVDSDPERIVSADDRDVTDLDPFASQHARRAGAGAGA